MYYFYFLEKMNTLKRIKNYNISIDYENKNIKRYINLINDDMDQDLSNYGSSIFDFDFNTLKEDFEHAKISKLNYLDMCCFDYPELIEKENLYWNELYDEKIKKINSYC
jgi:hypothetical protein